MARIRTKIYSNGTALPAGPTDSDPPFDFSAAKRGTLVFRAIDFGNADNVITVKVFWGVRKRGLISVKSNITWVEDTDLTTTIEDGATLATAVAKILPVPVMKSPLMKVTFTIAGTSPAAKMEAYFEQETE